MDLSPAGDLTRVTEGTPVPAPASGTLVFFKAQNPAGPVLAGNPAPGSVDPATGAILVTPVSGPIGFLFTTDKPLISLGYTQIAVGNVLAVSLGVIPAGAIYAEIQFETNTVRTRDDGGLPTPVSGMPALVGVRFFYIGPLAAYRMISTVPAGSTANVTFYKPAP